MATTRAYTLGLRGADSDFIRQAVDSDYITSRASSFDSGDATNLIGRDYIRDHVDSGYIQSHIDGHVDSAYVQALQTHQDFAYSSLTGTPNVLDSSDVTSIISAGSITDLSDADQTLRTTDDVNFNNVTVSGAINGPQTMYIDPAPVDSDAGLLVIRGDLQVDGTTTTVNSTTVTINDKNIVLADSAANASEADGAGITVNGANATITYDAVNDEWDFNKDINVTGNVIGTQLDISTNGTTNIKFGEQGGGDKTVVTIGKGYDQETSLMFKGGSVYGGLVMPSNENIILSLDEDNVLTGQRAFHVMGDGRTKTMLSVNEGGDVQFYDDSGQTAKFFWDASEERLGIGNNAPEQSLHVEGQAIIDGGTGVSSAGTLHVRQNGDGSGNGIAITSSFSTSHRIWKDSNGTLNIGPSSSPSAMVQNVSGQVGIGTSTPSYLLDVQGNQVRFERGGESIYLNPNYASGGVFASLTSSIDFSFRSGTDTNIMYLDGTNHRVGIGTENPDVQLHVYKGNSAANLRIETGDSDGAAHLYLRNDSRNWSVSNIGSLADMFTIRDNNAGQYRFAIDTSGNIGIGTTNPDQKLHVVASGSSNKVGLIIGNEDTTAGTGQTIDLQFGLARNSGTVKNSAGMVRVGREEDWTNDDTKIDSFMAFHVFENNSRNERVRFTSDGSVGINTTTPDANLHVHAFSNTGTHLKVSTGGSGHNIDMEDASSTARIRNVTGRLHLTADVNNEYANSEIRMLVDNSQKMVINDDGNVGIGETSPSGRLHVKDGDAGSITTNSAHDTLIVEGSANTGINIFSPNTSYQYLAFGDTEAANSGYVRYQHSINQMVLRADGVDTLKINNNKIEAIGHIEGGNAGGTNGSLVLAQRYGGDDYISTLGTLYSSGSWLLGYGIKPRYNAEGYVSSYDNFSGHRSALEMHSTDIKFLHAGAQQTTVGGTITDLKTPFKFDLDDVKQTITKTVTSGAYTFMEFHYNDSGGDLAHDGNNEILMDFKFTDANDNATPQVSLAAELGNPGYTDGGTISEGRGNFVVRVNQGTGTPLLREGLRVDWNGAIHTPLNPAALFYNVTDNTTVANGDKVAFGAAAGFNRGVTANSTKDRFTVSADGIYSVHYTVSGGVTTAVAGDGIRIVIKKNGSTWAGSDAYHIETTGSEAGQEWAFTQLMLVDCNIDDYLELFFENVGTTVFTARYGSINIHKVS